LRFRFNLWRKINPAVFGVNGIPQKSLCKFVNHCGKKNREIEVQSSKRKKDVCTEDAENAGEDGSVKRIIEEVDADAGHAIFTEGLNVRHSANEFAFEGREGFDFLGNFQAKLKLGSFMQFEARRKIRAAFGNVHGLCRKRLCRTVHDKGDLHGDTLDETGS
jgi:hypothetical protein